MTDEPSLRLEELRLALYRLGRQAESLAAYQRARQVLADELGTEPSRELQRLNEQILRRDPSHQGRSFFI
jgi:DNA-binding SARP family transcriptional activator